MEAVGSKDVPGGTGCQHPDSGMRVIARDLSVVAPLKRCAVPKLRRRDLCEMAMDAMAELERGDGAWENIQEVLRREFMKLWGAVADKKSRSAKNEQRLRNLESGYANKIDCENFRKQQAHVEAIARAVNALSEEMRSRDARMLEFEENTSAQLQASLDPVQDEFQSQLAEIESNFMARPSEVQESCSTMLVKIERRLELLEEELSILVAAIDKKADIESVSSSFLAQKKATNEAIRQRCKKAAFDKEVLAVHDLLRHQHSIVEARLDDALAQAKAFTNTQLQDGIRNIRKLQERKWLESKRDCEERVSRLAATREERLSQFELKFSQQIDDKLQSAGTAAANDTTETKAWLREVRQELVQLQRMQQVQESSLWGEQEQAHQRMREDLEHQLLIWKESVSKDWTLLQNQVNEGKTISEAMDRLREDHMTLKAVSEELRADFANASIALRDLEYSLQTHSQAKMQELQAQLSDEIAKALQLMETTRRAKDKRLKLQLDAYNEKLGEVDQVVKLVGKQLIQNTSQLQLVRKEQHARRQIHMAEELTLYTQEHLLLSASEEQKELDEDGEEEDEQENAQPSRNNSNAASTKGAEDHHGTDETMLQQLRLQHETVRHAIQDKLRHYQEVLQQE